MILLAKMSATRRKTKNATILNAKSPFSFGENFGNSVTLPEIEDLSDSSSAFEIEDFDDLLVLFKFLLESLFEIRFEMHSAIWMVNLKQEVLKSARIKPTNRTQ